MFIKCHLCGEQVISLALQHYILCPEITGGGIIEQIDRITGEDKEKDKIIMSNQVTKKVEGADTITQKSESVNLYTANGSFVVNVPVIKAEELKEPPAVIGWRERSFALIEYVSEGGEMRNTTPGMPPIPVKTQYREVTSYNVLNEDWLEGSKNMNKSNKDNNVTDMPSLGQQTYASEQLKQVTDTEGNVCPECGVGNFLHTRRCGLYQESLRKNRNQAQEDNKQG